MTWDGAEIIREHATLFLELNMWHWGTPAHPVKGPHVHLQEAQLQDANLGPFMYLLGGTFWESSSLAELWERLFDVHLSILIFFQALSTMYLFRRFSQITKA